MKKLWIGLYSTGSMILTFLWRGFHTYLEQTHKTLTPTSSPPTHTHTHRAPNTHTPHTHIHSPSFASLMFGSETQNTGRGSTCSRGRGSPSCLRRSAPSRTRGGSDTTPLALDSAPSHCRGKHNLQLQGDLSAGMGEPGYHHLKTSPRSSIKTAHKRSLFTSTVPLATSLNPVFKWRCLYPVWTFPYLSS